MNTIKSNDHTVYYNGQYWNDLPQVQEYINENYTGKKNYGFLDQFKDKYCEKMFKIGLVINCGNGWVERDLIDRGIVQHIIAFDYSFELLKEANKNKCGRNISYFQADVNKVNFPNNKFDLVVNHAALHHVQYLNRLCFILCHTLKKDGVFLNQDYVGPRRNQYSFNHWRVIKNINNKLPVDIQKDTLIKPHLPTMLHVDPSEAIHSDLIIEYTRRYFNILEQHATNGGLAYELLTHNNKIQKLNSDKLNDYIEKILIYDRKYTKNNKIPVMFSYFVAVPNKMIIRDKLKCALFQEVENKRELRAQNYRGVYGIKEILIMSRHALVSKFIHSRYCAFITNNEKILQIIKNNKKINKFIKVIIGY